MVRLCAKLDGRRFTGDLATPELGSTALLALKVLHGCCTTGAVRVGGGMGGGGAGKAPKGNPSYAEKVS